MVRYCLVALFLAASTLSAQPALKYFKIQVVDDQTNRGVPLVELTTTADVSYFTDSNGTIAFHDPSLMGQQVFFHVKSHGYQYPKDGFGYRGTKLNVTEGGSATLKIHRINIAERLYRITGEGIYRDSVLLGEKVPIRNPLINGLVSGQDSVMAIPYRNKIYWFWGDTNRPSYPLGQFGTSGATSDLPGNGGLDPNLGVDLSYFTHKTGFSRPMIAIDEPGVKWLTGIMRVGDEDGKEKLVARYDRRKGLAERYEHGLLIYNDQKEVFEKALAFKGDTPMFPDGVPLKVRVNDDEYYYFPMPYTTPLARVKATLKNVLDPSSYEGFVNASWKAGAKPDRIRSQIDFESGQSIEASGTVNWNAYRKRWIMIAQRGMDQTYYFEGDTPVGPWVYGRRIVQYDHYTMYNVAHHPFFDQENGRLIYFEGTYTREFSDAPVATPRYNYNQLMYRLDLTDPRLILPVPVYQMKHRYLRRDQIDGEKLWDKIESIPFFAFDRERDGLIPVYGGDDGLQLKAPTADARPLFFAVPLEDIFTSPNLIGFPAERPIMRVYRNPQKSLVLDTFARPPGVEN
ncbi:MAG TPA: hypothetical protein VGP99_02705 [Tepidisphaeraceae bacterium]|nr:hypothetical protein [Tepidisphaeraceae bacterium]